MSKTNYYAVAYKILTYLNGCLEEGVKPNIDIISHEKLGINYTYWKDVLIFLHEDGYIKGLVLVPVLNDLYDIKPEKIRITPAGIQFLEENSMISKAREFLKEIKDFIPGL